MAHISGSFSSPYAGRAQITLSGTYYEGTYTRGDFGSTGPTGTGNYQICGTVNGTNTTVVDKASNTAYMEMDYPGGNVSWSVSTQTVATSSPGGSTSYGMKNIKLNIRLIKK